MLPCSFALFPSLGSAEETRTLLKNGVNGHSREPRCQSRTNARDGRTTSRDRSLQRLLAFQLGTNHLSGTKLQRRAEGLTAAFAARGRTAGLCEMKPALGDGRTGIFPQLSPLSL